MRFKSVVLGLAVVLVVVMQGALASAAAPLVPSHLRVVASTNSPYLSGSSEVSWDVVSGATQYSISLTNSESGVEQLAMTSGEANTRQTFENLIGGVTYSVKVRTIAITEVSAWSSTLQFVPQTLPKVPSAPVAVAGQGLATVSWTQLVGKENGGSNLTGYKLTEVNSGKTLLVNANVSSADFPNLDADALASFTVTAISGVDGRGSTSPSSNQVTILATPSPTPTASATPTPTPTPQQIIQGGVGGGNFPAPASPSPSASPSPKPSKSAAPVEEKSPTPSPSPSPSNTATTSPKPIISKKPTAKPTPKASVKVSVKPKAKSTVTAKATISKKPVPVTTKSTSSKVDTTNWKVITVNCTNGKTIKKVTGKQPACPKGYWRK